MGEFLSPASPPAAVQWLLAAMRAVLNIRPVSICKSTYSCHLPKTSSISLPPCRGLVASSALVRATLSAPMLPPWQRMAALAGAGTAGSTAELRSQLAHRSNESGMPSCVHMTRRHDAHLP